MKQGVIGVSPSAPSLFNLITNMAEYHEMIEWIMFGALGVVGTLIGILYRIQSSDIKKNKDDIKDNYDKTDARLDVVEKDIVEIKIRQIKHD